MRGRGQRTGREEGPGGAVDGAKCCSRVPYFKSEESEQVEVGEEATLAISPSRTDAAKSDVVEKHLFTFQGKYSRSSPTVDILALSVSSSLKPSKVDEVRRNRGREKPLSRLASQLRRNTGRDLLWCILLSSSVPATTPSSSQVRLGFLDRTLKLRQHLRRLDPDPVDDGLGLSVEAGKGGEDLFVLDAERGVEGEVLRKETGQFG